MFIETSHPLSVGTELEFSLTLPDDKEDEPVLGKGRVIWTDQAVGVGIEFVEISDEDRERIKWYVAEVFFG